MIQAVSQKIFSNNFDHQVAAEIKAWRQGFMRDCPSGVLTPHAFCSIYKQFFPKGNPEEFARYKCF